MRWMIVGLLVLVAGCEGPMGQMGAPGEPGPTGSQGPMGSDGSKITASITCGGALAETSFGFFYEVIQFENGNVFSTGEVSGGSTMGTATSLYAPSQNGYLDAAVIFTWDVYGSPTGGWWRISLDRDTLATTVVYHDTEVDGTPTWTMDASKCTVNAY